MRLRPSEILFTEDVIRTTLTEETRPLVQALVRLLSKALENGGHVDDQTFSLMPVFVYQGKFWSRDYLWLFTLKQFNESTSLKNLHFPVRLVEVPKDFSPPVSGGGDVRVSEGPVVWEELRRQALFDDDTRTKGGVPTSKSDVRQRFGAVDPKAENCETSFSEAEDDQARPKSPIPEHHIIDNSAFEAFCLKAGIFYVLVIAIMVLTYH